MAKQSIDVRGVWLETSGGARVARDEAANALYGRGPPRPRVGDGPHGQPHSKRWWLTVGWIIMPEMFSWSPEN